MRAGITALAFLAVPAASTAWTAPASAEPRPWHSPASVTQAPETRQLCAERDGSWPTRSRCPVQTKVATEPMPNMVLVNYQQRLATVAPNKAQIEYQERLATVAPNKAQIEYQERLAAAR